jgi:uroporphyrinogen decarboxylase
MPITHRERIETLISGGVLDQLSVAFWWHFPLDDQNPARLASATIHFQNTFDMDIIKVSPSSSFCLKDWGVRDSWIENTEGTREYLASPIQNLQDLKDLPVLDAKKGFLGSQLNALKFLIGHYGHDTPLIQTIFSPLAQLKNLLGKGNLLNAIRNDPKSVREGLETIVQSTLNFLVVCSELKIDGIFFAVQHASSEILSNEEFLSFGKEYDQKLFFMINKFWLNILHIHGTNIYFDLLVDYPMQIINWHDRETAPDLLNGRKQTDKIFCGGLSRIITMVRGDENKIKAQIDDAVSQTKMRKFILGTGCVLPIVTPYGNIKFAIDYSRSLSLK